MTEKRIFGLLRFHQFFTLSTERKSGEIWGSPSNPQPSEERPDALFREINRPIAETFSPEVAIDH
jgi:hypothetical protein